MVRIIPAGGRRPASRNDIPTQTRREQGRVEELAADGRGVVRLESGRVVLVARVWPGDVVEVRTERGSSATLLQLLESSPERREPPCRHFSQCGGCPWQMVSEKAQAGAKQQRVARLAQQLQLAVEPRPLWRSPLDWYYRNRAQLKTDGRRLGFMGPNGLSLADITSCPVLTPGAAAALSELRTALPNGAWRGRGGKFRTWHIDEQQPARLDARQPFRQGNSAQNQRMREWLGQRFIMSDHRRVLELFAGSGNFTEVMAGAGASILAVEVVVEALAEAPRLPGVDWLAADLFGTDSITTLTARARDCVDLVLDPPRAGFERLAQLVTALPALQRVLYVSCDPATFARDVAPLANIGWGCVELQPVDLFPQTPHVELLAEFQRL